MRARLDARSSESDQLPVPVMAEAPVPATSPVPSVTGLRANGEQPAAERKGLGPEGGAAPWLPQPADWAPLSVAAQEADPTSTLRLYRDALRLRRAHLVDAGPLVWLDTQPGVLAFRRGTLTCWLNTSDQPAALPGGRLLLGSAPGQDDRSLPVDAAAWVDTS